MWSYYGTKTNIIKHYPGPTHGKIIEPFAGAARYALRYWKKDVLLVDRYPEVIKLWKFLQAGSDIELDEIPLTVAPGQTVNDFSFTSEGAKLLFQWIIGKGTERPKIKASERMLTERPNSIRYTLNRIRNERMKILHWDIICDDYRNITNQAASWFIDPPYQEGGAGYVYGSSKLNYRELANYCLSRRGQVIVCEKETATWLPFGPLVKQQGMTGNQSEGIYYIPKSDGKLFRPSQLSLF